METTQNYLSLIYFLIDNTKINNDKHTSNNEIKERFFKKYPEYRSVSNLISGKIGFLLNLIYGNELTKVKESSSVVYNIECLSIEEES